MGVSRSLSVAEQHNLIATAKNAVSRFAYQFSDRCGNKHFFSRQDIEDMVGDVCMKAWRSLDSYNPEKANLKTWVTRIAFNCLKDSVDYRMKRLSITGSLILPSAEDEDGFDTSEVCDKKRGFNTEIQELFCQNEADGDINRREFEQRISEEVGKLSEKNQRFYRMHNDDLAPRDIAALEGCTPNAASKRIYDIRHTLRGPLMEATKEFDIPYYNIAS